eukprot:jgi/Botrbrau1/6794/Bobra.0057s0026.1
MSTAGIDKVTPQISTAELGKAPQRIRLPIPFLPIDLVIVSDPVQIDRSIRSEELGRCFELPSEQIPRWLRLFLQSSRFYCGVDKSEFVHLLKPTEAYEARLSVIKSALDAQPHSKEDVTKVWAACTWHGFVCLQLLMCNALFLPQASQFHWAALNFLCLRRCEVYKV